MVLETVFWIIDKMFQLDPIILLVLIVLFVFIAFKFFHFLFRVVITGIAFGILPIVAYLLGFGITLSLQTILWSALLGIILYLIYSTVITGLKIIKIVLSPFNRLFSKKQKVKKIIIKEERKKD